MDEKLQDTLEKRLGESFKLVSERLELVHKGLGEMQSIASGVGDLKKVLTNVKTKGILGSTNWATSSNSFFRENNTSRKSPPVQGRASGWNLRSDAGQFRGRHGVVAIDSKFPLTGYETLLQAREGDLDAIRLRRRPWP